MAVETETQNGLPKPDESRLFGLSIRAVITLIVVSASTGISVYGSIVPDVEVHEPLYSMTMVAVGFFFGQVKPKQ